MTVQKLGVAVPDPAKHLWALSGKREKFAMNLRLVESRPDYKDLKKQSRFLNRPAPSRSHLEEREAYFEARETYQKNLQEFLVHVYAEIRKESFSSPILLRKDKDYEHHSDWRFCLYRGCIYRFDRPGYTDSEMMAQIEAIKPVLNE